jgi:hypothetical protein
LEVLALEVFKNVTISDYPSGVRFFFDKVRTNVKGKNADPAGYGDDIGRYINSQTKVAEAVANFQTALDQCLRAEQLATNNDIRGAVESWRKLFSNYFPAYG